MVYACVLSNDKKQLLKSKIRMLPILPNKLKITNPNSSFEFCHLPLMPGFLFKSFNTSLISIFPVGYLRWRWDLYPICWRGAKTTLTCGNNIPTYQVGPRSTSREILATTCCVLRSGIITTKPLKSCKRYTATSF